MEEYLCSQLAKLAPPRWAETTRRHGLLKSYLAQSDRSVAAIDRYAAEAGLGRSIFYRLARIMREWHDGSVDEPRARRKRQNNPQTFKAVNDAVAALGLAARPCQVLEEATRLCAERQAPVPTERQVRTLYVRHGAGERAAERLRIDADFAIDAAPLALVVRECELVSTAHLLALLDLRQGSVVAHVVTCGYPKLSQAQELVWQAGSGKNATSITLPLEQMIGRFRKMLSLPPGVNVVKDRKLAAGSAVRAVLGDRLGRIRVLRRAPTMALSPDAIDIEITRSVIARLIVEGFDRSSGNAELV